MSILSYHVSTDVILCKILLDILRAMHAIETKKGKREEESRKTERTTDDES